MLPNIADTCGYPSQAAGIGLDPASKSCIPSPVTRTAAISIGWTVAKRLSAGSPSGWMIEMTEDCLIDACLSLCLLKCSGQHRFVSMHLLPKRRQSTLILIFQTYRPSRSFQSMGIGRLLSHREILASYACCKMKILVREVDRQASGKGQET